MAFDYNNPKWRKLRNKWLKYYPRCRWCGIKERLQVDHKMPIAKGGNPYSYDNLQTLCISCHSKKTGSRDKKRVTSECGVDGIPIDPKHPWGGGE